MPGSQKTLFFKHAFPTHSTNASIKAKTKFQQTQNTQINSRNTKSISIKRTIDINSFTAHVLKCELDLTKPNQADTQVENVPLVYVCGVPKIKFISYIAKKLCFTSVQTYDIQQFFTNYKLDDVDGLLCDLEFYNFFKNFKSDCLPEVIETNPNNLIQHNQKIIDKHLIKHLGENYLKDRTAFETQISATKVYVEDGLRLGTQSNEKFNESQATQSFSTCDPNTSQYPSIRALLN